MKIVILSRYQDKVNRGVESVVEELVQRLSKLHDVEVFGGSKSDDLGSVLKGNFDVVMPMNGRLQSLKMSLGRASKNYKLVIGGHSGIGKDDIWNIAVCRPDIFVALTEYMANWANKWAFGVKITHIPNGIDLERFNPKGEKFLLDLPRPIILSVGALAWYKHHERVVEAVATLGKGSVVVVGDGEERERLDKLGKERLPGRFKLMKVGYSDMPSVYRAADLFTLPSWDREAFGVVYLESMATNVPVVAPDDQSRREIVGDGGVLINVEDVNSYAKAIEGALNKKWGNLPRLQAEKFNWDKIAKEYDDCLRSLF